MFKTTCAYKKCDKECLVYGKDKQGNLPIAYCGKICEANAKYDKRFDNRFDRK